MTSSRGARDLDLIDALDKLTPVSVHETVWRVVREGRDPLLCYPSAGRWDPGHFDVLYTSLDRDRAVSEMYFHLSRQPVFPSNTDFTLNEIEVTTYSTLKFTGLHELEHLGVDPDQYSHPLYQRTQEIGDAAAFLGRDRIIAPSARWNCLNLAIFCDSLSPEDLILRSSSEIDWNEWRTKHGTA